MDRQTRTTLLKSLPDAHEQASLCVQERQSMLEQKDQERIQRCIDSIRSHFQEFLNNQKDQFEVSDQLQQIIFRQPNPAVTNVLLQYAQKLNAFLFPEKRSLKRTQSKRIHDN